MKITQVREAQILVRERDEIIKLPDISQGER